MDAPRPRRTGLLTVAALLIVWIGLQAITYERFIYHDAWKHGFPMFVSFARHATCGALPTWIGRVDSGSPVVIQVISTSLTHLVRLPAAWLTGCLDLDLVSAVYLYKVQLIVSYVLMAVGMLVLGHLLFAHRLSAWYLFIATLYAGLFLDGMHSSQVIGILFWIPWIAAAAILCHRHAAAPRGGWSFNALVLFIALAVLDQYPHYVGLAVVMGGALYLALWPRTGWTFLRANVMRLWPAVLIMIVTGVQFWVVKQVITPYKPSLRGGLVVDPALFGETGFVQPTALLGTFLPFGFLVRFDQLGDAHLQRLALDPWLRPLRWVGAVSRAFIFRLDLLLFVVGFIAVVLAVAFIIRPGARRRRVWWVTFALGLFLVALQQSGLYLLMYEMPFFNVLRIYFLYIVIAVFALLVMSAYGMDTFLILSADEARRTVRRAVVIVLVLTVMAALVVGWLATGTTLKTIRHIVIASMIDALVIAAGAVTLWRGAGARKREAWAAHAMIVLAVSQIAYFGLAHQLLSIPLTRLVAKFGLETDDVARSGDAMGDPNRLRRKACQTYAQCYLSRHDTISLRRDQEATFLRHQAEPVFQDAVAPEVVRALSGVTHPVFWLSQRVEAADRDQLITALNRHAERIGEHLREVAYVAPTDIARLDVPQSNSKGAAHLLTLERGPDWVRLTYTAADPVFLNAAITYDEGWSARLDGQPIVVVPGNLNALLATLPPGSHTVELRYRSLPHDTFFALRFGELVAGVIVAVAVAGAACRRPNR